MNSHGWASFSQLGIIVSPQTSLTGFTEDTTQISAPKYNHSDATHISPIIHAVIGRIRNVGLNLFHVKQTKNLRKFQLSLQENLYFDI